MDSGASLMGAGNLSLAGNSSSDRPARRWSYLDKKYTLAEGWRQANEKGLHDLHSSTNIYLENNQSRWHGWNL